jgi:3-dehydroquinate dehydratase II
MKQILIINGPNLNLLGTRQPQIYGEITFDEVLADLRNKFPNTKIDYLQSNHEGEIIDALQQSSHNGIVLNAGGYTHTSVAIRDAISAAEVPVVEVHISNISARESFRHESLLSPVCQGVIFGFGVKGYELAVGYFAD